MGIIGFQENIPHEGCDRNGGFVCDSYFRRGDESEAGEPRLAAVQSAIKSQIQDATILGITSEKEDGKTTYEVETKVNGKGRDVSFDQKGAVVETEDAVDLNSIPADAKTALQKRAATGTITKVEKITEGTAVSYEAAIKTKAGKSVEAGVNADGTTHKED